MFPCEKYLESFDCTTQHKQHLEKFVESRSFEPKRRGQGNCSKLDFGEIQLIEHLKLAKASITYREIVMELNQHSNIIPFGTSVTATSEVVPEQLKTIYKKLVKVKGEKFTPQNILYCQNFLSYSIIKLIKTQFASISTS